jgi:hypothetical protein
LKKNIHAWVRDWFAILVLFGSPMAAGAVVLELGDILVAEPAGVISVIDPSTGAKTVITQGDLLAHSFRTVGVAAAPDGSVIVVHRSIGLIRVNPATGSQSILSEGGLFRDPWAIAIDNVTGAIYVADSGYDNDRPEINEAGKIIRVDPVSGQQQLIASGNACNVFPANAACQNTPSPGSYLTHPYGIAIDYSTEPATLVVADMSSFNGQGAIIRIQAVPSGAQTLVWGPATASPPPQVIQASPLECPMGVAVEPNGNILTTTFTYPVPATPTVPPPAGTFYGCAAPGIFRLDLASNVQVVVNTNAPLWQPTHAYAVGEVIRDPGQERVHQVVTAGTSQGSPPSWNGAPGGTTVDGSVVWRNIGLGANWLIPFGLAVEPAPTPSNASHYNLVVMDEGYSSIFRLDADGHFLAAPLASNLAGAPSLHVVTVLPTDPPDPPDPPPVRSNGQPSGTLPSGTSQTTLGLTTDEDATCRYSTQPGVAYASMTGTFTTTGTTTHSTLLSGLVDQSYSFYVRCADALGNANTNDFVIAFSIGNSSVTTSAFVGTESVLSEGGRWDSPGSWADMQKDNGAFATGLNAQARLVTPAVGADQYAEITYDQDPGLAGQSWVGVATRIQGAGNGSGYLAIAYAGEVRLYRTDDAGGLNFVLLASASADIGTAPRRLRLESEGNTHRVYFNGVLMITHVATGTIYATGQPGIAASVFGGPQVKILSFEGGSLDAEPVDTTPPETSITGGPDEVTTATSATFTFTSNESGSTFECRLDAAAFAACSSPRTFTDLEAGNHSFAVRATDAADNTDPTPATLSWTIDPTDTTPPETSITGGPDEVTNSTSATFTFISSEAGSSFECRLDGAAFTACTSPRTLTGLAAGGHVFEVRATDAADNTDPTPAGLSWSIDQTAPDTAITSGPISPTNSTDATFTFTSTDAGSSFQCRLDAAEFSTCSTPISYSNLASGNHTFRVRAVDAAGNVDGSPAVHTWTIDTTAPNTTITGNPGTATSSTSATFTFTSSQANSTFQCNLDGAGFSPCASPVTYSDLTQGNHNFQVQATDPAGNPDPTPASFSWTVDSVLPDTTIDSGPPSLSRSRRATFTFSSDQAGATFQCSLNGGAFANCSSPRSYSKLPDGPHNFRVRARDAAGNTDPTPASYDWTVDGTAPSATIDSGPATPTNVTTASFTFSSNDPAATLQCRLDGAAFAPCVSPVNYSGLANGTHRFRVRAIDAAGNVGATVLYTWIVDTTPPNTTITGNPGTVTTSTSATFTFTASQAGSSLACSLDGAAFTSCSSPATYTGLATGSHNFRVRATDPAGNTDPTPASFSWTVL